MRTVLTIWNTRIAPVFDVAGQALLVESENGTALSEQPLELPGGSFMEKVAFLAEVQTDLLVCGAISRPARFAAHAYGIDVYSFIAGNVREVIQACLEGRLKESAFAMPGCGRTHGCRGRRGQGRGKGESPRHGFFDENETE